jgi:hypothetical protein
MTNLSEDQLNLELEKGYGYMKAGRTISACKVFRIFLRVIRYDFCFKYQISKIDLRYLRIYAFELIPPEMQMVSLLIEESK